MTPGQTALHMRLQREREYEQTMLMALAFHDPEQARRLLSAQD